MISKSKDGNSYYSKITNDFNGKHTEKFLSLQIPKQNNLEYGLYDVDGFMSVYEKKDGTTEFKFIVMGADLIKLYGQEESKEENPFKEFGEKIEEEIGEQLEIAPDYDLPF